MRIRSAASRIWHGVWLLCLCGALQAHEAPQPQPSAAEIGVPAPDNGVPGPEAGETAAPVEGTAGKEPARLVAEPRAFAQGVASWYGGRFHGRTTASGEPFDMHALTAAHPTLPFGTLVQVRSLVNGRVVDVRINDRGPYAGGRIIDLSRAAAAVLGLLQSGAGTKPVQLKLLRGQGTERSARQSRSVSARRSSAPPSR